MKKNAKKKKTKKKDTSGGGQGQGGKGAAAAASPAVAEVAEAEVGAPAKKASAAAAAADDIIASDNVDDQPYESALSVWWIREHRLCEGDDASNAEAEAVCSHRLLPPGGPHSPPPYNLPTHPPWDLPPTHLHRMTMISQLIHSH